jgi:hypothetical protein
MTSKQQNRSLFIHQRELRQKALASAIRRCWTYAITKSKDRRRSRSVGGEKKMARRIEALGMVVVGNIIAFNAEKRKRLYLCLSKNGTYCVATRIYDAHIFRVGEMTPAIVNLNRLGYKQFVIIQVMAKAGRRSNVQIQTISDELIPENKTTLHKRRGRRRKEKIQCVISS